MDRQGFMTVKRCLSISRATALSQPMRPKLKWRVLAIAATDLSRISATRMTQVSWLSARGPKMVALEVSPDAGTS